MFTGNLFLYQNDIVCSVCQNLKLQQQKNEKDHADIREFSLANFSTRNSKRGDTAMYCKII